MVRTSPLALSLLLVATPGAAQSRLELFAAIPIPATTVEGTFTSDYVPSLVNGGTVVTGRGSQTLQVDGGRPLGWLAGANWLITPHAGVQVCVGRASHAIVGANAPHQLQLTYLARQPPDYVERQYVYNREFETADTAAGGTVVAELLNAEQMIFAIPLDRVQAHLGTAPVRFSRWGGPAITVGVRVR